jgi:hypothetical protein
MKIPKQIDHFGKERMLLIVASKQRAQLFDVGEGRVEEVDEFKVEKPKFSDHENQFKMKGRAIGGSASYEYISQWIVAEFLKKLKASLKKIKNRKFNTVAICVPSTLHNIILRAFPVALQSKIVHILQGNFTKTPTLEIVGKIDALRRSKTVFPETLQSRKIRVGGKDAVVARKRTFIVKMLPA